MLEAIPLLPPLPFHKQLKNFKVKEHENAQWSKVFFYPTGSPVIVVEVQKVSSGYCQPTVWSSLFSQSLGRNFVSIYSNCQNSYLSSSFKYIL